MHISYSTALVAAALAGSILLVLQRGDRVFPIVAVVAAGVEALIVWRIIQLSSSTVRIDVILPALLAVAGAICWARSTDKPAVTAATVVTIVGLLQLLTALQLFK
ncbi:MAG TPA: hypothetical protein VM734_17495 [Kofleriaceae bacterium]|jgi:hypothetical protein|nr:hypothetical protein [Kofleriaceae bacterium]